MSPARTVRLGIIVAVAIAVLALGPVEVRAATVTTTRDVVIAGPYGQLTLNNDQSFNSYTTYANGTIYFNVTGLENSQQYYDYRVRSYGNGTMIVKFEGRVPTSLNQPSVASYAGIQQQFRFARDESGQLCVSYAQGFCQGLIGGLIDRLPEILLGISIAVVGAIVLEEGARIVSASRKNRKRKR